MPYHCILRGCVSEYDEDVESILTDANAIVPNLDLPLAPAIFTEIMISGASSPFEFDSIVYQVSGKIQ